MKVTFVAHSMSHPVGGVTALYEFANGLSRRGCDVTIAHARWTPDSIRAIDELDWFRFDDRIRHTLSGRARPTELPDADVIVNYGRAAPSAGLPVGVLQGYGAFPEDSEDRAFHMPWPKICVARWLVEIGLRKGVPANRLWYVPNGIDHEKFRVLTPIEQRPVQVSMLYSTHHQKGGDIGLEALAALRHRVPDVRIRTFGTTAPPGPLPAGVEFDLLPSAHVLVHDIYNGSRVFVCPSRTEGFGFCSVEAMACGAALVTTDNGGSRDFALDDETALVCDRADPIAIADRVEALLRDDERRQAIARRGEEMSRSFDRDRSAEILESFLVAYVADPDAFRVPRAS